MSSQRGLLMEKGTLRRPCSRRGGPGARSNGARGGDAPPLQSQPAANAELAANGVVECASERAPRSTTAAWDKRETIAW